MYFDFSSFSNLEEYVVYYFNFHPSLVDILLSIYIVAHCCIVQKHRGFLWAFASYIGADGGHQTDVVFTVMRDLYVLRFLVNR